MSFLLHLGPMKAGVVVTFNQCCMQIEWPLVCSGYSKPVSNAADFSSIVVIIIIIS